MSQANYLTISNRQDSPPPNPAAKSPLLSLRILRGPLDAHQEETILAEFNRLTDSAIPLEDFRRWVRDAPEGPACHAILETDDSRPVGHICLVPLAIERDGQKIIAARTEYFFVHEDFRASKVRGFQNSAFSSAILLLDQLYRHWSQHGGGPILASASEKIQPFHKLVGCKPVNFPLHECLLILRPWSAAKFTPNLTAKRRAALFAAGLAQTALSHPLRLLSRRYALPLAPVGSLRIPSNGTRLAFFQNHDELRWRYPAGQYAAYVRNSAPDFYLIAKHGSPSRYLRICQSHLEGARLLPLLAPLIDHANSQKALGLRWSVYSADPGASSLVRSLRKLGFICAPRNRRLLIYSHDKSFLSPAAWHITDSFFSFDL